MSTFTQKVEDLIEYGWKVNSYDYYLRWSRRTVEFLNAALGSDAGCMFASLNEDDSEWEDDLARKIGHLEGLALRIESVAVARWRNPSKPNQICHHNQPVSENPSFSFTATMWQPRSQWPDSSKNLAWIQYILHEQSNDGRTVIEKFEAFSNVPFAIALLTSDDIGSTAADPAAIQPRARQNVILELGYFVGKLGRSRVSALFCTRN